MPVAVVRGEMGPLLLLPAQLGLLLLLLLLLLVKLLLLLTLSLFDELLGGGGELAKAPHCLGNF